MIDTGDRFPNAALVLDPAAYFTGQIPDGLSALLLLFEVSDLSHGASVRVVENVSLEVPPKCGLLGVEEESPLGWDYSLHIG